MLSRISPRWNGLSLLAVLPASLSRVLVETDLGITIGVMIHIAFAFNFNIQRSVIEVGEERPIIEQG